MGINPPKRPILSQYIGGQCSKVTMGQGSRSTLGVPAFGATLWSYLALALLELWRGAALFLEVGEGRANAHTSLAVAKVAALR